MYYTHTDIAVHSVENRGAAKKGMWYKFIIKLNKSHTQYLELHTEFTVYWRQVWQSCLWGPTRFKNQTISLLFLWQTTFSTFCRCVSADICADSVNERLLALSPEQTNILLCLFSHSHWFDWPHWDWTSQVGSTKTYKNSAAFQPCKVLKRCIYLVFPLTTKTNTVGYLNLALPRHLFLFSIHPTLWSTAWIIFNDLRSVWKLYRFTCNMSRSTKPHASNKKKKLWVSTSFHSLVFIITESKQNER